MKLIVKYIKHLIIKQTAITRALFFNNIIYIAIKCPPNYSNLGPVNGNLNAMTKTANCCNLRQIIVFFFIKKNIIIISFSSSSLKCLLCKIQINNFYLLLQKCFMIVSLVKRVLKTKGMLQDWYKYLVQVLQERY